MYRSYSKVQVTILLRCSFGGEGGIRTREDLTVLYAFQAYALVHYATSPDHYHYFIT